jgi:hypothetical protein
MAEKSSFFNSVNGDRTYAAEDWARYFASFIGNGVFGSPGTNLQVSPSDGMSISVATGLAWINGYFYVNDDDRVLVLATADGTLPRVDRVVVRWSLAGRAITTAVKTGTAASSPVAPALQRDSSVYELAIADVYVAAGATTISSSNITDRRSNATLCGTVSSIVSEAHAHELSGTSITGTLPIAKGGTGAATDTDARANLGITPINIGAAAAGHTKIVELLLRHGADPSIREQGGYTPLHAAAQNGDVEMIKALIYGGADLDTKSNDGKIRLPKRNGNS